MTRFSFKQLAMAALACMLASSAGAVTIDMVTVGNPGNANDPATGNNYGGVGYSYKIAKYETTIQQYTDFLNATAATDVYGLYDQRMGANTNIAGIAQLGVSGSYTYSAINNAGSSGNRPIAYVSWFDAARFANWMQNGQGSGSTETGAYTLNGATSGNAVARNPGATFYIPTENEWYKAAYYDPTLNSNAGGYWTYATRSNTAPGNTIGSGANQANYYVGEYPNGSFANGGGVYSLSDNYLTDVGVFAASQSAYGTFDQSGNLYEWTDLTGDAGSYRSIRGGEWGRGAATLSSSDSLSSDPESTSNYGFGFRLASPVSGPSAVPEIDPNSLGIVMALVLGSLALLERRRAR